MERDANVPTGSVGHWVKPGRKPSGRMPSAVKLDQIARALGCSISEVSEAFALDNAIPLELASSDLSVVEQAIITDLRACDSASIALARNLIASVRLADESRRANA